jgi:hypothetical protein
MSDRQFDEDGANMRFIAAARQLPDIIRQLRAERDEAIAKAVADEREACAILAETSSIPFDIEIWIKSTKKEMTAIFARALAKLIRERK